MGKYYKRRVRKKPDPSVRRWPSLLISVPNGIAAGATLFAGLTWWDAHENGKIADAQTAAAVRLAAAADRQTRLTARQLEINRHLASAAEAQALAQQSQAKAALLLVDVQRSTGGVQAEMAAATESVQRPRLAMTSVSASLPQDGSGGVGPHPVSISFQMTNVGGSALTVLEDRSQILLRPDAPPPFKWSDVQRGSGVGVNVPAGYGYGPTIPAEFKFSSEQIAALRSNKLGIYIADYVRYRDVRGREIQQCFFVRGSNYGGTISGSPEPVPDAPPCNSEGSKAPTSSKGATARLLVGE